MRSNLVFALLLVAACKEPPQAESTTAAPAPLAAVTPAALVDAYLDAELADHPEAGRVLGLHEYDGKVSKISPEAIESNLAQAKAHLDTVAKLDLSKVEDPTKLDVELTKLDAEATVFRIEKLQLPKKILTYSSMYDVSGYLVRDYAPLAQRTASMLDHLDATNAQVGAMLAMLDPAQIRTHLETAEKAFGGMKEYFEGDVKTMTEPARTADPALEARYQKTITASLAELAKIMAWIAEHKKTQTENYALGEANFVSMLEVNEGLKMSLDDLKKMAQADFQKNHDAFVATAKKIDPKKSVQEVAELVANERLKADQVLPTARKQLEDLLAFIDAKKIITIGSDDRASVVESPPFMRWNSAFLDSAGPFEKATGSYYYISPPDPSWDKAMQESYLPYEADLLATSIHEVYPGHFVQGLQVKRAKSRAQKMLDSYAFVEGWAHYTEEMMIDAGFGGGSDRVKLGQLSNALLRNCRFLAAIGLHTGGMTVDQADKLFQEQCFIDKGNAVQQAYRGTFDPGYLSYTLGKIQILELRKKYYAKHGENLLGFHDWLLSFGNAPVTLIAERL